MRQKVKGYDRGAPKIKLSMHYASSFFWTKNGEPSFRESCSRSISAVSFGRETLVVKHEC